MPHLALSGVARGLVHQRRLLDQVLLVSPLGVLIEPHIGMEEALMNAGFTALTIDGLGRQETYWAVRHIRLVTDLGLSEKSLRLLLSDASLTVEQWVLLLRVQPLPEEVLRWREDGWPDQQVLETLAALRAPLGP